MGLKPKLWEQLLNQLESSTCASSGKRLTNQLVQMLLLKGAVTFVLPTSAGLCRYCCLMVNWVNWIFIGIWFDLVSPIWRSKDLGPFAQALDL